MAAKMIVVDPRFNRTAVTPTRMSASAGRYRLYARLVREIFAKAGKIKDYIKRRVSGAWTKIAKSPEWPLGRGERVVGLPPKETPRGRMLAENARHVIAGAWFDAVQTVGFVQDTTRVDPATGAGQIGKIGWRCQKSSRS